jgi:hypothetical protein
MEDVKSEVTASSCAVLSPRMVRAFDLVTEDEHRLKVRGFSRGNFSSFDLETKSMPMIDLF